MVKQGAEQGTTRSSSRICVYCPRPRTTIGVVRFQHGRAPSVPFQVPRVSAVVRKIGKETNSKRYGRRRRAARGQSEFLFQMEQLSESPVRRCAATPGGGLHGGRDSVRCGSTYSRSSHCIVRLQHSVRGKQFAVSVWQFRWHMKWYRGYQIPRDWTDL